MSQFLTKSLWFAACLTLSMTSISQTTLYNGAQSNDVDFFSSAESTDFLPVEQAYQVAVSVAEDHLLFSWTITDGYYLYRDRFKFNAVDATTQLKQPTFEVGKVKWDEFFEAELEVYYQRTEVSLPFSSATNQIEIQIESQGCADAGLCYPPYKQWITVDLVSGAVDISITPSASAQRANSLNSAPDNGLSLAWVLLFAVAGGVILNLMPCVFPVLSIKALSFTRAHQSLRDKQVHTLAYTVGVISSFIAIALIMLILRSAGESIGWGFQLQSPIFVIALVYLFFVMGLAFSGYVEIGSGLMSFGQSSNDKQGLSGSFMTGVLATTVASPCTAPFMGPALGFAVVQSSAVALLVFAFLGLGMALPFILLTWVPALNRRLPKPGQWMETFKQFLAFPLYLTAVWLLWVAGRQTSVDVAVSVIVGLILTAMAAWLWKLSPSRADAKPRASKILAMVCLLSAILIPTMTLSKVDQQPKWQPYSPERLAQLRAKGQPVFINLTADWCITCLVNERTTLDTEGFYQALEQNNIAYLKGDWTDSDPEITKLLNQYQRSGVPLYLLFPSDMKEAQILPQILVKASTIDKLNNLK
ncbi:MAG: protein-disulfide reductase DsbD family protein [Porticoccaceae bacterium]